MFQRNVFFIHANEMSTSHTVYLLSQYPQELTKLQYMLHYSRLSHISKSMFITPPLLVETIT